jgi:hypothetical protein
VIEDAVNLYISNGACIAAFILEGYRVHHPAGWGPNCAFNVKFLPNVKEHAPPPLESESAATEVLHGGCCVSSCSLSSIREAMLYAACDSEEGIILTPMNGTEIVLNDAEAKQLGEWLLHITSQDSRSRRSVDSSVTAACPSDDSTPNG